MQHVLDTLTDELMQMRDLSVQAMRPLSVLPTELVGESGRRRIAGHYDRWHFDISYQSSPPFHPERLWIRPPGLVSLGIDHQSREGQWLPVTSINLHRHTDRHRLHENLERVYTQLGHLRQEMLASVVTAARSAIEHQKGLLEERYRRYQALMAAIPDEHRLCLEDAAVLGSNLCTRSLPEWLEQSPGPLYVYALGYALFTVANTKSVPRFSHFCDLDPLHNGQSAIGIACGWIDGKPSLLLRYYRGAKSSAFTTVALWPDSPDQTFLLALSLIYDLYYCPTAIAAVVHHLVCQSTSSPG